MAAQFRRERAFLLTSDRLSEGVEAVSEAYTKSLSDTFVTYDIGSGNFEELASHVLFF